MRFVWPFRGPRQPRATGHSQRPAQSARFAGSGADNPIHRALDAAGVPWRIPRSALAERYGTRKHPAYLNDVIEIDETRALVKDLLWPMSAQVLPQFSPHVPAIDLSGVVSVGADARENLRHAMEQLTARLGEPEITDQSNTVARRWRFGPASLTLTAWPSDLQRPQPWPTSNPAHDRDPRLETGCHLWLNTGFRMAATAEEGAWLGSFVPIGRIGMDARITAASADTAPAPQYLVEFVREPAADAAGIFGLVGHSADRAALIFSHDQLYLVAMADVIGFRVERLRPAKGPGGSRLCAECRTDYAALAAKKLLISSHGDVEGSNELAAVLAAATAKPYEIGPYMVDD